jgi:hypothetical protein
LRRLARSLVVVSVVGGACLPTRTQRLAPREEDAGTPPAVTVDAGDVPGDAPTLKPHAVLGISPPHGPFSGGTLSALRGNGFRSNARVWFGDTEVPPADVLVLDPGRIQLTSPPGPPGAVDVTVQNGDDESTRATLPGGFTYDDFYLEPLSGPTVGGTLVTVHAGRPLFDDGTSVDIDLEPCPIDEVLSPTELTCRTPPGTPGSKGVRIETGAGEDVEVLDAFSYVVDSDGFRGGLSGEPLAGQVAVLVVDSSAGLAIPGATVLAGERADSVLTAHTDSFGTALIQSPDLHDRVTLTIAKKCFQPQTFVDVPVEKLTVFLQPVLSPDCGDPGSIPAGGGGPGKSYGFVNGQLVWPLSGELKMKGFGNVPAPGSDTARQVAYVFRLSSSPTDDFSMGSASSAVTPDSIQDVGYAFSLTTPPGNFTIYALAGIEDRSFSPPLFTPYALGLTRGVAVASSGSRSDVFISVDQTLDHALSIDASGPKPTSRGPDRLEARLAIEVGSEGYVLLPNGLSTSLLPTDGPFRFVGIPALAGTLTGSRYIATASAVTGSSEGPPLSAVGLFATVTDAQTVGVGAFLELPQLTAPASSTPWDRSTLALSREPGGPTPDLTRIDVSSGRGLITWRIVAPGAPEKISVPDLSAIDPELALVAGSIAIDVNVATIDDFSYASLASKNLRPAGWRAHAEDVFYATY